MGFLYAFLVLVLAAFIGAGILLVVGSLYFDACNSEIPPGVEQPAKLHLVHVILIGTAVLGRILENLHITTQAKFERFVKNGWKPRRDSTLFIHDTKFENVPVRIYQPKAPSAGQRKGILFFHGGGFVFGSIRTHENICRYIARESDSLVVSVEYRLAPEHTYPDAFNDGLEAAIHFLKTVKDFGVDQNRIIFAGDSSGGYLAAMICQTLVNKPGLPKVRAQVLLYPCLQAVDFNLPSYQQNRAIPPLFREQAAFYVLLYSKGNASYLEEALEGSHVPMNLRLKYQKWLSADHIPKEFKTRGYKPPVPVACDNEAYEALKILSSPECSPLLAEDALIRSLPETFILTCEYDVLRDDGLLYKKRLEDNGITVTWHHLSNAFHGILSFFDRVVLYFPSGKKGMDLTVDFIRSL